jgi:hypothetical protein
MPEMGVGHGGLSKEMKLFGSRKIKIDVPESQTTLNEFGLSCGNQKGLKSEKA